MTFFLSYPCAGGWCRRCVDPACTHDCHYDLTTGRRKKGDDR